MSSILELVLILFSIQGSFAAPLVLKRQAPTFIFDGDAPFTTAAQALSDALTCPNGNPTAQKPPVLLVHGTATTGEQTWGKGYVPALAANGYTPCYVTLPDHAMGDMQVSSEYIAYSIHHISQLSNNLPTAIVSHSQGGPDTQWALQFWPSTRAVTRAFVALSPDFQGVQLLDSPLLSQICTGTGLCQPSLWQQSAGSKYYDALHAHGFTAQVPTTVVWSHLDEVVIPAKENAALPGATVVAVQDLCPLRVTDHLSMTVDAAGFALVLDALANGGHASTVRLLPKFFSTCFKFQADNMDESIVDDLRSGFDDLINGFLLGSQRVPVEPAVLPYAA